MGDEVEVFTELPLATRRMIPLEVCERIIDVVPTLQVPDNTSIENSQLRRSTLVACALTCRSWLFRSRYHLHQDIIIFDKGQLDRFFAVLRTSPSVGTFVRNVRTGTRPQSKKMEDWVHLIPVYLAGPLTALETLAIQTCNWRVVHPSFFVAVAQCGTVTRLVLQTIKIGSSRELTRLVFSFAALEDLTIREIECLKSRPCQLFKNFRKTLPLRNLLFRRGLIGYPLLRLLGETNSNATIETMEIDFNPEEVEARAVGEFIRGCSALTFLFLQLPLQINAIDPALFKHVSLEDARYLARFKYCCILSPSNFSLFVHVLRTIPPRTVTELFVKFFGGWTPKLEQKTKALEEVDWASLDTVLSGSRYSSLASLCIQIDYLSGLEAVPAFLEKHMPKLSKKKIYIDEVTW